MELRTLQALVEVVRQGGFTAAAKTLFATQSAVSKSVRQLEEELGRILLERRPGGVRLTEAGEIVYRRALRLLAERDDLAAELADLRGLKHGTLRLGLPPLGSGVLFAPLFARFRALYPGVEIQLVEHGSDRLEEILRAGEIDFAAALLPTGSDLEWIEVRREPLVAVLAKDHPLAARPHLRIDDLRAAPFILYESGFALNRIILGACRRAGFEPKVVARSSQIDFIIELAAAGLGAAFIPRLLEGGRPRDGRASVPLDEPDMNWRIALAWRHGAYLSDAAQAWLELVRQSIRTTSR